MSETSPDKLVIAASGALGEVVKLGKESPDARAAGTYAAKSLRIVAQTVHTLLLPLAAANYGAQKFATYMQERFGPELAERLEGVPEASIVPPRSVLAGPVLDSLVYAHEEDELRALYLSLLAGSMDARTATDAHPAFVDVLRQVDAEEIKFLRAVLGHANVEVWPVAKIRVKMHDGSSVDIIKNVLDWRRDGDSVSPKMGAAYVDNWVRLGLVVVTYSERLRADVYGWVQETGWYAGVEKSIVDGTQDGRKLDIQNGVLEVTEWGKMFAAAVRISETPEDVIEQEIGNWQEKARLEIDSTPSPT
nr:DUF4393 domain-containing protein [Microbacterium lemovicicum]